jgi:hypothetical protein
VGMAQIAGRIRWRDGGFISIKSYEREVQQKAPKSEIGQRSVPSAQVRRRAYLQPESRGANDEQLTEQLISVTCEVDFSSRWPLAPAVRTPTTATGPCKCGAVHHKQFSA